MPAPGPSRRRRRQRSGLSTGKEGHRHWAASCASMPGQVEGRTMTVQAASHGTPSIYMIHGPSGLRERAGTSLGVSNWVTLDQIFTVDNATLFLNYGLTRVRLPAAVLVGTRMRMHVTLAETADTPYVAE